MHCEPSLAAPPLAAVADEVAWSWLLQSLHLALVAAEVAVAATVVRAHDSGGLLGGREREEEVMAK